MFRERPSDGNGASAGSTSTLVKTLGEVDELLGKVEQIMVASHSHSPFNDYLTQLSDEQRKVMRDGIDQLRTTMLCLVRRSGTTVDGPHVSAVWAIRRTLASVAEKLAEASSLTPIRAGEQQKVHVDEPATMVERMKSVVKHMDGMLV